jgi:hypothetical protein
MTVSLAKLGKFADMEEICADLQMVVVNISASPIHCFAIDELDRDFFSIRNANLLLIVWVDKSDTSLSVFHVGI